MHGLRTLAIDGLGQSPTRRGKEQNLVHEGYLQFESIERHDSETSGKHHPIKSI